MIFIALFALLLAAFSVLMIVSPSRFSQGIIQFSQQPWFHLFEISSRLLFGLGFVIFADSSIFSTAITLMGYVLILVGIGLAFTPKASHIRFAELAANYGTRYFRFTGCCALPLSVILFYSILP